MSLYKNEISTFERKKKDELPQQIINDTRSFHNFIVQTSQVSVRVTIKIDEYHTSINTRTGYYEDTRVRSIQRLDVN